MQRPDAVLSAPASPEQAVSSFEAARNASKVSANQAVDILSSDRIIPFAIAGKDAESEVAITSAFLFQNTSDRAVTMMIEFFGPTGARIALPTRDFNGAKRTAASVLSGTFGARQYDYLIVDATRLEGFKSFWVRLRTIPSGQVEVFHETLFSSLDNLSSSGGIDADLGYIGAPADRSNIGNWIFYMPPSETGDVLINVTNGYSLRDVILTVRARASNGRELCRGQRVVPVNTMYSFDPAQLSDCFASLEGGYLLEVVSDRTDLFANSIIFPTEGPAGSLPRLLEQ